jgi:hypothetical protein
MNWTFIALLTYRNRSLFGLAGYSRRSRMQPVPKCLFAPDSAKKLSRMHDRERMLLLGMAQRIASRNRIK